MSEVIIILQMIMLILFIIYLFNNNRAMNSKSVVIDKENKKEMEKLLKMKRIKLTEPLTEKSRPTCFEEIIGQEDGIKALKAAICGPNPQHVIIYGPPGIGKTAAARLVLEEAKKREKSKERYKIEAKNSELKHRHGYDKASSSGLIGMEIQGALAIFTVNIKRILKILG